MAQRFRDFLAWTVSSAVNCFDYVVTFACSSGWKPAKRVKHVLIRHESPHIKNDKPCYCCSGWTVSSSVNCFHHVVTFACSSGWKPTKRVKHVLIRHESPHIKNDKPCHCSSGWSAETAKRVNNVLTKYESPQTKHYKPVVFFSGYGKTVIKTGELCVNKVQITPEQE